VAVALLSEIGELHRVRTLLVEDGD